MLLLLLGAASVLLVVWWLFRDDPSKLFGVYSQPGKFYHIKYAFFYCLYTLRQWRNKREQNVIGQAGYGRRSRNTPAQMECAQPLSNNPKAIDAVYFNAANKQGCYLVAATARRPNKVINGFIMMKLPNIGLLLSTKLPDTILHAEEDMTFGAEGLTLKPLEPMRKWKLLFNGPMRLRGEDRTLNVIVDLVWESTLPYFDFDTELHPTFICRGIAREPWSGTFFKDLEESHQTHYEQFGWLRGTITVEGFPPQKLIMGSMRDHSYGKKREWKYLHRYAFHMVTLEDGTQFNVGVVSQPITTSVLEMGYLYTPVGEMHSVNWTDFDLAYHGEGGTPPSDYGFRFRAGGKLYNVQCLVQDVSEFYIGFEWEARIVERLCLFIVNGKRGWGISEWHYRHHGGRPKEYSSTDPQ
ncbi:uncharacterized protein LOC144721590 [Lampetra planeri]